MCPWNTASTFPDRSRIWRTAEAFLTPWSVATSSRWWANTTTFLSVPFKSAVSQSSSAAGTWTRFVSERD